MRAVSTAEVCSAEGNPGRVSWQRPVSVLWVAFGDLSAPSAPNAVAAGEDLSAGAVQSGCR